MKKQKLILISCVGSILEYYDFIIYGMMASYIAEIFFVQNSTEINYLKTFSILAVGYLARPLGGYLFGVFSDIYGRKKTLMIVMGLMAGATLSIGFLPSFKQVGIIAPLCLTFARILQGLSFGAEIPSISTIIKEHSKNGENGKYFGLIISSTSIGTLMASLMVYIISHAYSHEEIIQWAWRVPFLIGGLLALIVFFIRNRLDETPDFIQGKKEATLHYSTKKLSLDLVKNHWKSLSFGLSFTIFFSYLIILSLYLPIYFNKFYHIETSQFFSMMSLSIAFAVVLSPLFGHLFERFDRIKVLQFITIAFVLFLYISLQMFNREIPNTLSFFLIGYQVVISAYATNLLTLLPKLFPTAIRVTGIGVCYNLAFSMASVIPLFLTPLIQANNHIFILLFFSIIIVAISLIGSYCLGFEPRDSSSPFFRPST